MDREGISEVVRQCLDEAFATLRGKRAGAEEWTREIKAQLCLAGAAQQPPLHVCASAVEDADDGEWLHDVCWLGYGEDPDFLNEVVLILECEWGGAGADSGRIRDDFHKLVAGRARVRCMIWKDGNGRDDPAVVGWLAGMMGECVEAAPTISTCWPAIPPTVSSTGICAGTGRSIRCRAADRRRRDSARACGRGLWSVRGVLVPRCQANAKMSPFYKAEMAPLP